MLMCMALSETCCSYSHTYTTNKEQVYYSYHRIRDIQSEVSVSFFLSVLVSYLFNRFENISLCISLTVLFLHGCSLSDVSSVLKKKFACGCSVVKGTTVDEVHLQGDFADDLVDFFSETYQVSVRCDVRDGALYLYLCLFLDVLCALFMC